MRHQRVVTAGRSRAIVVLFVGLAILGAFVTWLGVGLIGSPDAPENAAIGPLLIGLTFMGSGNAGALVVRRARTTAEPRGDQQTGAPVTPWNAREDWATGRITGGNRAGAWALGIFAFIWNAFTWPVAWLFLTQKPEEEHIYFVLVFPAGGVFLAGLAVYAALQARKHGRSVFVLRTIPGVVGRTLEGHIEMTLPAPPSDGAEIRLRCMRRHRDRRRRRGESSSVRTDTVWQDHVTVEPIEMTRGISGVHVPVAFEIPGDALPSDERNPYDMIMWRLEVSATVPGIDYSDSFDVPVFDTGDLPLTHAERDAFRSRRRTHAREHMPPAPLFTRTTTFRGGTTFSFAPRTTLGSAAGAIAMTAASWTGLWWLIVRGVPVAPFIVGFFALLFTAGTVVALFHRTSLTVEDGEVTVRHRILGLGTTRRWPVSQIVDVRSEVVGEGRAQSWEVMVHVAAGKSYGAAAHLDTQRDADWTAEQMLTAIRRRG